MYLMFLGPYQEGGDFRDEGISGIRRFLDRVWALVGAVGEADASDAALRKLHQTIRKVGSDIEGLRYNTAIAAMMEYQNLLRREGPEGDGDAAEEARAVSVALIEPLVILLAPFAPHFAEECWERLGHTETVFAASWPAFDPELAREQEIELVVQVNGKVRGRVAVPAGLAEPEAVARAKDAESVRKFVADKQIRKAIYVKDRLVNLVV
jgi:leucyl-tRNA synthetase